MGKLNHHAIDNGNVKITTSDVPVESNYDSVTDPETTPIKSIDVPPSLNRNMNQFNALHGEKPK